MEYCSLNISFGKQNRGRALFRIPSHSGLHAKHFSSLLCLCLAWGGAGSGRETAAGAFWEDSLSFNRAKTHFLCEFFSLLTKF